MGEHDENCSSAFGHTSASKGQKTYRFPQETWVASVPPPPLHHRRTRGKCDGGYSDVKEVNPRQHHDNKSTAKTPNPQ